jgi:hypothetical protein
MRLQSRRIAEVNKQIQFEIGHVLFIDNDPRFQKLCDEKPK